MPELDGFQTTASIRANEGPRGPSAGPHRRRHRSRRPGLPPKVSRCRHGRLRHQAHGSPAPAGLAERWIDKRPVVLIADDSADSRTLLSRLLQQVGDYRVVQVRNGAEAVDTVRRMGRPCTARCRDAHPRWSAGHASHPSARRAWRPADYRHHWPRWRCRAPASAPPAAPVPSPSRCSAPLKETVLRFLPERLATPYTAFKTGEYSAPKFAELPSSSLIPPSQPHARRAPQLPRLSARASPPRDPRSRSRIPAAVPQRHQRSAQSAQQQ